MTSVQEVAVAGSVALDATAEEIVEVAKLVGADLGTRAELHDREGTFAPENFDAIWKAGLGNLTLARNFGGLEADLLTTARVIEAIALGDPSTALIVSMHWTFLRAVSVPSDPPGERVWPDHLRDRLIHDSLAGPALVNGLRVEPELGTPARGGVPATTARLAIDDHGNDAWILNGRKIYSTGSYGLRWMNVWAVTENDPEGPRIGSFLVSSDSPGVTIDPTWDHLGMRATASHDVVFTGTVTPFDHAIGLRSPGAGRGGTSDPEQAQAVRGWTQVLRMALYASLAKSSRDWLAGYLNERIPTNLGAPLSTLERFQVAVGQIEAYIYTNDQLLFGTAEALDAGGAEADKAAATATLMKTVVSDNTIKATELALSLIGNPGLMRRHPLERFYRDALCSRIHNPQADIVLGNAGRAVLGVTRG